MVSFVTILVLSSSVNADIVSVDWQTSGDNLITRDTNTGLEWLDLTTTTSYSYNDVSLRLGSGQQFDGWRYASRPEVSSLLDAFGGNNNYYDGWSTQNNGLFDAVHPYWGNTGGYETVFITSELDFYGNHTFGSLFDWRDYPGWVTEDRINLLSGYIGSNDIFGFGHALVREVSTVPVPAAAWLFGSGLIGLIGVARRKKA